MTFRHFLPASLLSATALLALPDASRAQQPVALPGLNVQGATLAKPSATPQAAAATDTPVTPIASTDASDGIALEKIGASVSVVTRSDIERQQIRNASDALRSLPGVSVSQSGTSGNLTVVRIRGAESRHTLVVIDGVEMNASTDGAFDFSNLAADDIQQIEVLRGAHSGLYGNGALGGVINITTLSGKGPAKLRVQAEGGTNSTGRISAQLSGGNTNAWGSIAATGFRTNGFNISPEGNENDDTRIGSFAAKGGVALSQNFRVEANYREQNTRAGYDNGSDFFYFYGGFLAVKDAPYISEARARSGGLTATLDTFNKAWTHSLFVQGTDTARNDFTKRTTETLGTNSKIGYRSTLLLEDSKAAPVRHYVTALIEQRTETFEQPSFAAKEYVRHRNSIAGEIRGEYFRSLFVGVTLRHDDNDDTRNFTTWNVNASYLVPGGVFRAHSSAGIGVKYPSFTDLYGFFDGYTPNPNLKPEESRSYDIGLETKLFGGQTVIDVTYFNADLTNEITTGGSFPTYFPINLAESSTRRGIEVAGRTIVTSQITLGASYTYLLAHEVRNGVSVEEVRRPRHQGRLDANYVTSDKRGNVNVAAIYNGNMKDIVTDTTYIDTYTTLPSYWNVRLAAGYKVQPGVELFGRVENLLNQRWQEVYGYNATSGATAFAGVKLTFGGKDGIGGTFEK